jgi:hypothetical protein
MRSGVVFVGWWWPDGGGRGGGDREGSFWVRVCSTGAFRVDLASVLRGACAGLTPAALRLPPQAGSVFAFEREELGIAGVRVPPPQI